jgi:hypothetical protein
MEHKGSKHSPKFDGDNGSMKAQHLVYCWELGGKPPARKAVSPEPPKL